MKPLEGKHAYRSGPPGVATFLGQAETAHFSTPEWYVKLTPQGGTAKGPQVRPLGHEGSRPIGVRRDSGPSGQVRKDHEGDPKPPPSR